MSGRPQADSGRILWDGFGLQSLYSGVGRHAWDLLQALAQLDRRPQIIPSVPSLDSQFSSYVLPENLSLPQSRIKPWSLLWSELSIRKLLRNESGMTLVHGLSNYNVPVFKSPGLRTVLTVHDLIPILGKDKVSKALGLYLRYQLPRAVKAADAIICVSHWTENTLHDFFPESRGKTVMIPNGWPRPSAAFQAESGLLTISRNESYKRLDLIPAILKKLPSGISWTVVTDETGLRGLQEAHDSRLILRTRVSDAEIDALHAAASLYVHPSLLEGFCLPAAASISRSVPVLYTRGSGIDEVVGPAGRGLFPTDDASTWASAIEELLSVPDKASLCRSRNASAASWDDVAARTRALYDKLGEW